MQHACRQRNRGSGRTQHLAQKFVRQGHAVRLHAVVTGKKPSRQTLANRVPPVASGILRALNQMREHIQLACSPQVGS